MRQRRKDRWGFIAAGLLTGCALPPLGFWPVALPGFAALLALVRRGDRAVLFVNLLLFLAGAWGVPFHWVVLHPIPAAAASSFTALLAYAVVLAAWTSFLVTLWPQGRSERSMTAVLAWVGFDVILARGPFAMPWLSTGLTVSASTWASGWASLAGFHGVTLALLLLALALMRLARDPVGRTAAGIAAVLLIVLPFPVASGPPPGAASLDVALVEPGWTPDTWAEVRDTGRVARLASLVATLKPSDLVVFPETALPTGSRSDMERWIEALAAAAGSPVVAGGILATGTNQPAQNIAVSSTDSTHIHAKRRLVPFAEHMPFSDRFPLFNRFSVPSGGVASYGRGSMLDTVNAGNVETGLLICFESLFARDARHLVRSGADLLIVLTQDGWWGSDTPRRQHALFSRLLASALGSPVLHATVDGHTQAIDAAGRQVPMLRRGDVYAGRIPMDAVNTPFRSMGDWPFFAIFAALVLSIVRRRVHLRPA